MALCPGDTTEWDDIQRKFGNLAPLEKEVPQRELDRQLVESADSWPDLYVQEVTEASDGGQWVLLLLYTNANFQCHPMMKPWAEAAKRFPMIKFLQGVASEIIPDFPDSLTPTVIIYKDKECVKQVQGLDDWGGGKTNVDTIEWHLAELGIIETDQENDPRNRPRVRQQVEEEFDEKDAADDRTYTSSRLDRILRGKWT
eukprot:Skav231571  [mRNA]  locus=scaffold481:214088:215731:- [translate_table: standard]